MDVIEFDIESESSSKHWKYFDVYNKNVLDLGCGRWSVSELNEMSPFYFYKQNAQRVVGLDSSIDEIIFFNSNNLDNERIVFVHSYINSYHQIKDLISKYNIQAIKCDIEGSENVFFSFVKNDFDTITEFALEYHNDNLKQEFLNRYKDWGFILKAHGKFSNFNGVGVLFFAKN